jgi:folylpolyglutamate synthase/dihydropteroate synthase
MPASYSGFAAMIRFVVSKTTPTDKAMGQMLDLLRSVSVDIETTGKFDVSRVNAEPAARGLAGIAKFLQEHILPEALHVQDEDAIEQVKYAIEGSLALSAEILKQYNDPGLEDRATFSIEVPKPKGIREQ